MWNYFLIFLSKNPFLFSVLPVGFAILYLLFGRKSSKYQILGTALLVCGIGIGSFLHFRWDSFAIHFFKIHTKNFEKNKILFIGDSITSEGNRPKGFITKIESLLQTETQTIFAKGATSDQIKSLVENYPYDLKPSYIFAQSGINDLICGFSEEETAEVQNKLVESIRSAFPTAIVLFIPIHPFYTEKQHFVPSPSPSLKTNIHRWWGNSSTFPKNYLIEDGIHLNAKGHTLLAKKLAKLLNENI